VTTALIGLGTALAAGPKSNREGTALAPGACVDGVGGMCLEDGGGCEGPTGNRSGEGAGIINDCVGVRKA